MKKSGHLEKKKTMSQLKRSTHSQLKKNRRHP